MNTLEQFFSDNLANVELLHSKLVDQLVAFNVPALTTDRLVNIDHIEYYQLDDMAMVQLSLSGHYDWIIIQKDYINTSYLALTPNDEEMELLRDPVIKTLNGQTDLIVGQYNHPISTRFGMSELRKDYSNSLFTAIEANHDKENKGIYNLLSSDLEDMVLVLADDESQINIKVLQPIPFAQIGFNDAAL